MIKFFVNRLIRRILFRVSIAVGCIISILYVVFNVLLPGGLYKETVYTKWIEALSPSEFQSLFFMMIPILSAIAMAELYLSDKNSGYLDVIFTKASRKRYFGSLYGCNFVAGGLCMLVPLIVNLYLCFLVCPSRAPDMVVEGTNIINYYGQDTLFPSLYYEYPFVHVCVYLLLGFIAAGIMASLALALSFFVKAKFIVWIGPFVLDYVYISLVQAISNSGNKYTLMSICVQQGGQVTLASALCVLIAWTVVVSLLYLIGVKTRVRI